MCKIITVPEDKVKKLKDSDFAHFLEDETKLKLPSEIKPYSIVYSYHQGRNKLRNRKEAVRAQLLPTLWPVRQLGHALEPNVVVLTLGLHSIGRFIPSRFCWV